MRWLASLLLVLGALLVLPCSASAKEGGRAWLMSSIPRWAEPGTVVHVSWIIRGDDGSSFDAIGMFVRFTSGSAGAAGEGFASATAHPMGEYEADVTVPEGGIGRIEFGLAGTAYGPNMPARRSDMIFPVANLKWTTDAAVPDGLPPPDSITNKVTKTSPTAGAVLLTKIPLKSAEGTTLRVMWRVRASDGRYDFGSVGMFVRLTGWEDGGVTEAFSSPTRDAEQPYEAEVTVPRGGIARVQFGIAGNAAGQRSDRLFPIVDVAYTPDEIRPAHTSAVVPPSEIDRSRWSLALTGLTIVAGLALAIAATARALRGQVLTPSGAAPPAGEITTSAER